MGSYGTNGNLELSKLVENLEHVGTVTKATFPVEVTVDGKSFSISSTGIVGKPLPTINKDNLKVTTVADKEIEITTTSTNKPEEGTPLEIGFDVSISEGTITAVDRGTLTNGKVTYDTDGTETEVIFTFTLEGVDSSTPNTVRIDLRSYYDILQVNSPNVENLSNKTYVTWTEDNGIYTINDTQTEEPENWYDYSKGKWANLKITNGTLNTYWVWIPRYEYKITSSQVSQIQVKFITTDTTLPDSGYTIHPAFTFNNTPLDGIWVAKFEASSSSPTAQYGGAYNTNLQVQVQPNVQSWRSLTSKLMYDSCRKMQQSGGALEYSTNIDSHMMKNTEWGAVAILSQSKYGVFNTYSTNSGIIWKNNYVYNSAKYIYTGYAGSSAEERYSSSYFSSAVPTGTQYNKGNGPKASTTGTVYGVYDMAGGAYEIVAGCFSGKEASAFGVTAGDDTYVDLYTNTTDVDTNYNGAIKGDATKETKGWNSDDAKFVISQYPVFCRGGIGRTGGDDAGIFAFDRGSYSNMGGKYSFRPVLIAY